MQDFRSENGLYSMIQAQHDKESISNESKEAYQGARPSSESLNHKTNSSKQHLPTNVKGKDLFDSQLWSDPTSTSVFYRFISSLREKIKHDVRHTTATHRFIRTLRDRRKLIRCYTQNIDGLEAREKMTTDLELGKGNRQRFTKKFMERPLTPMHSQPGGESDPGCEVVQLHGGLDVLRCTLCQQTIPWDAEYLQHTKSLLAGRAPLCQSCIITNQDRKDRGRRETKIGTLRPNIILYGEEHPSADLVGSIAASDLTLSPDLLLILGTSLNVHGLKNLVREFSKAVHARAGGRGKVVFVNLSRPAESVWRGVIDIWVDMDCDAWVRAIKKHRPDLFLAQEELKLPLRKAINASPSKKSALSSASTEAEKENLISDVSIPVSQVKANKPKVIVSITQKKRQPLQEHEAKGDSESRSSRSLISPDRSPASSPSTPETSTKKRKRSTLMEKYYEICETPSKRRKSPVKIWSDVGAGA